MKKRILYFVLLSNVCCFCWIACSKKDPTPQNNTTGNTTNPPVVSLEDTLCRKWEVKSASHNGTSDPSSIGLKLTISKDGSYILHNTSYNGTWEFIENKAKVLLDKNTPSYKTTWTIVKLTSKNLEVTFKSPFTGGNASWSLKPY